jgi:hypothetical protein
MLCPTHLALPPDQQNSYNGMTLKLIEDLCASTLERGVTQFLGKIAGSLFLNATFGD